MIKMIPTKIGNIAKILSGLKSIKILIKSPGTPIKSGLKLVDIRCTKYVYNK